MQSKTAQSWSSLRFPWLASFSRGLLAVVLLLPACSGGLHSVHGKVLYDGKPIKGAVVTLRPKTDDTNPALRPTGVTDENGEFTLMTENSRGAAAGEYRVTIRWLEAAEAPKDKPLGTAQGMAVLTDRLKGRYEDPEKSGLTVVIKSGSNELEPFNLK